MNADETIAALGWEGREVWIHEMTVEGSVGVAISPKGDDVAVGVWLTNSADGIHADIRGARLDGEPIQLQVSVLDADVSITVPKDDTP